MAENDVKFTISADTRPASQAIVELQKELKNIGNIKSVDKKTVAQQRELKKVAEGVSQAYEKQQKAYQQYGANTKKIEQKTAALQKEEEFTKKLTEQYNELLSQQEKGTITPEGVNTLSRLSETIPHRLEKEEKLRSQINTLVDKNAKLDEYSEQVLQHIFGDEQEIVKDESTILGYKLQQRAVTQDAANAESVLKDKSQQTNSAMAETASNAKKMGDALKDTKNEANSLNGEQIDLNSEDEKKDLLELRATLIALKADVSTIGDKMRLEPANGNIAELRRRYEALEQAKKTIESLGKPKEADSTYTTIVRLMTQINKEIRVYKRNLDSASASQKELARSGDSLKSLPDTAKAIKSGFRSVSSVSNRLRSTFVGVARDVRSAITNVVRIAKSGFSTLSGAIKKVTSHFNGMSRDMKSNFKHMITSITKYVLGFRSLFFLVRRLRKYIGEGIKSMAQFNDGNNHVNESITRLLSSLLYLKNAWATAFSPILQFVTPWLEALIDKLAAAGNAFSRFLGNLLGQSVTFQAVKVKASDYASTLDKVGGSAGSAADKTKKLTDRLAAFDDLNVLGVDTDPDKNGSGGGGGAGDIYEPNPNDMFKIVSVGNNILEKLKEMWTKADFSELGEILADKLKNALETANNKMPSLRGYAYKIGKSIATLINGAFSDPELFTDVGEFVAGLFNAINSAISNILKNTSVDWGGGFASLINALLENTNWDTIKSNLSLIGQQLKDNINSFLSTLSPEDIQKGATALSEGITSIIVTAITGIDWNKILGFLYIIGSAIIEGISNGLVNSDNLFISAVGNLLISIKDAFEQGDATVVADGITTFFKNVFGNIDIDTLIETAKEFLSRLLSNVFDSFTADEGSVVGELLKSFKMIGDTLISIFSGVLSILPELLPGILLITQASMDFINALWPLIETLLPPLNDLVAQITSLISSLLVPVLELLTPVITLIAGILDALSPIIEMVSGFIQATTEPLTKLLEPLMHLIQVILTPLQTLLEPIMKIVQIILDLLVDLLTPVVDLIAPLIEILVDCLTPIFDEMSLIGDFIDVILVPAFKLFADIIRLIVIPILKAMIAGIEFLSSVFKSLSERFQFVIGIFRAGFNELRKLVVDGSNFIASKIESLVNGLIGGINKMIRGLNKVSIDIPDWIPEIGGNKFGFQLKELSTVSIPRLAQGAVIPPNREFMAVLGDQSHGTNIEAPLDTIKQAVAEVLANNGNAEVIQLLQQLIAVVESKNLTIGDKEIGKANARYVSQQQIVRGTGW